MSVSISIDCVFGLDGFNNFLYDSINSESQTLNGIVIDNFEYLDGISNHGWAIIDLNYNTYGYGYPNSTIRTVFDLQVGSRVLDLSGQSFPTFTYLLPAAYRRCSVLYPDDDCLEIDLNDYPILTFKLRTPPSTELSDLFEFRVHCNNGRIIRIIPEDDPCSNCFGTCNATEDNNGDWIITIGNEFFNGEWHIVWINLLEMTDCETVCSIQIYGSMLRIDDITFKLSDQNSCKPYLFKIGPRYAQIFEQHTFLFYADYLDLCGPSVIDILIMDENYRMPGETSYSGPQANIFETDSVKITSYWKSLGADPNYLDPNSPLYGTPEPNISQIMRHDIIIDINRPIFADPNLGIDPSTGLPNTLNPAYTPHYGSETQTNQTFFWSSTTGGAGANCTQCQSIYPLPIDPFDGIPTHIPVYGQDRTLAVISKYGKPFLGPSMVSALESALYYAGFSHWPGIAVLYFTPSMFDDIIITLEVTTTRASDYETFPLEIVNYPIVNYTPLIGDCDDQFFTVGVKNVYGMSVVDPDNMIFSLTRASTLETSYISSNLTDNFRTDMSEITWQMTLTDLPIYQHGPWMQSLIDPITGLISFTPLFEGAYNAQIVYTDNYGASASAEFTIFIMPPDTWLNHPPVILINKGHQIARAGEGFILTAPEFQVFDPDADEIHFSCNIGYFISDLEGNFMWTFIANFPGQYTVQMVAYDTRGGHTTAAIDIQVEPWWIF